MTRSRRRNELERDEFNNDNPNPRMRPAYSALVHKLREMKMLEDPAMTELVIDDMIYYRFLRSQRHPDSLWYLLKQVHSYWLRSLGEGESIAGEALQIQAYEYAQKTYFGVSEKGVFENLNEDDSGKVKIDFLDDKGLKKAVRIAIQEHSHFDGVTKKGILQPTCRCGREFDLFEEWANHARSVIWRILNESIDSARDNRNEEETPDQADQADRGESEATA